MLRLDTTTRSLQIQLADAVTTNQLQVVASYSDKTASTYNGASELSNTNDTTPVTIASAPAASTIRDIDYVSIVNRDTIQATVLIILDDNGTPYTVLRALLEPNEQLIYTHGQGWQSISVTGGIKTSFSTDFSTVGLDDLNDVVITTPVLGQPLIYNGTSWINSSLDLSNAAAITGNLPLANLAALTASRAVVTDGSGILAVATTTSAEIEFVSGVTSSIQTQLDDKQPLDDDLTALAGLSSLGYIVRTGAGSVATRTFQETSNQIVLTNADGVGGDTTIAIANNPILPGTGAVTIPQGTTAQEPTVTSGMLRYDTTLNRYRGYDGTSDWIAFVMDDDPRLATPRIVYVNKDPGSGQFGSIKDAVDSIVDNTATTPYVVYVAPGTYTEDQITLKPYVFVVSNAPRSVIVVASDPTDDLVIFADDSGIRGLTLSGASTSGSRAAFIQDVLRAVIFECYFTNNATDIHVQSLLAPTQLITDSVVHVPNSVTEYGARYISVSGQAVNVSASNTLFSAQAATPALVAAVEATGVDTTVKLSSVLYAGAGIGTGLLVSNGADVRSIGILLENFDTNVHVPNIGAAPTINLSSMTSNGVTFDINVEHPDTEGSITGTANQSKVFIDPASPISVLYHGPVNSGNGTTIVGHIHLGNTHSTVTSVNDLILEGGPIDGVFDDAQGVVTTTANPLEVSITPGFSYVHDDTSDELKRIEWSTQLLTLPDDTDIVYVYIDNDGAAAHATSVPSFQTNVLLARARTRSNAVQFILDNRLKSDHASTRMDMYARLAIGPIFSSGSITIEHTTPFQLAVSAGSYWYGTRNFTPAGGAPISFITFNHVSGIWTPTLGVVVVNNTHYDNGTDLVALTTGYYTKHLIALGGDGSSETYALIYGQAEYETLLEAQLASIPTPPPFFLPPTANIASIIVQEGASSITEIDDLRPRLGFTAPALTAATTHGNLFGLDVDDHLQYLRTDGTRALTGNLDLGTNNIVNVNLVDGVDVSAHASRHLPNGADPITTATAVTLSPSTTNGVGTANSLARSDHTHLVSGFQLLDADLTAIAALATTGFAARTAADTWALRTILGTTNQIVLTNGTGVAGDPTVAIATDPILPGTGSVTVPTGTTAQRPGSPTVGMVRHNTDFNRQERYEPNAWVRAIGLLDKSTLSLISASADEVDLLNYTLPGGTIGTDGLLRIVVRGFLSTAGSSRTWTVRLRLNGSIVYQDISPSQSSNTSVGFSFELVIAANNSVTAQTIHGVCHIGGTGGVATGITGDLGSDEITSVAIVSSTSAIDTANNMQIQLSIQQAGAGAAATITRPYYTIEKL